MNIIFDMDGVIFDTERLWIECSRPAAEKFGLADIEKVSWECIGLREEETEQKMLDHYGADAPLEAFWEEAFRIFQERYREEGMPLKEGAVALLEFLKQKQARIALGTSTAHDVVEMELRDTGLLDYFDVLVCGDMVEHSKPEPDVFLLAAEMLGAAPEDCIVIEDSYNGVIAAKRSGATVFMVPDLLEPTEEIRAMADRVFGSLDEVREYLDDQECDF